MNLNLYLGVLCKIKDHESIVGRENIKKLCELYAAKLEGEEGFKSIFTHSIKAQKFMRILSSFNEHLPGYLEVAMENSVLKRDYVNKTRINGLFDIARLL